MVGNDIIDLELTRQKSNWRRKGFAEKVFTSKEQEAIFESKIPFVTAWRLWSMKESAYKLFIQTGGERFFIPLHLKSEIISSVNGIVDCHELRMYTRTNLNSKFIFTSVSTSSSNIGEDKIFILPKADYHFQSNFIHRQMLICISRNYNLNISKLQLRKTNQGVPEVTYEKQKIDISFSMTHHGYYGAISWFCPNSDAIM